jgi:hypothetical protein
MVFGVVFHVAEGHRFCACILGNVSCCILHSCLPYIAAYKSTVHPQHDVSPWLCPGV